MIPNTGQIQSLWETYRFPEIKRTHSERVARVAEFLAGKLEKKGIPVNIPLLVAAALLHDIDKNIEKLPFEQHPDAGVRILRQQGMEEVGQVVRTHPLHSILDPQIAPKTIEEKLLFLSDKMVKHEVITVDKRFALWYSEQNSREQKEILDNAYPLVKRLEQEIFSTIGVQPEEVAKVLQ